MEKGKDVRGGGGEVERKGKRGGEGGEDKISFKVYRI